MVKLLTQSTDKRTLRAGLDAFTAFLTSWGVKEGEDSVPEIRTHGGPAQMIEYASAHAARLAL